MSEPIEKRPVELVITDILADAEVCPPAKFSREEEWADKLAGIMPMVREQDFTLRKIRSALASHRAFSDPEGTLRVIERALEAPQ